MINYYKRSEIELPKELKLRSAINLEMTKF